MTIKLGNKRLITIQDFTIPFKQIVSSLEQCWQQDSTRNAKNKSSLIVSFLTNESSIFLHKDILTIT